MAASSGAERCARCGTELPQTDAELVLTGTSPDILDQRWVVAAAVASVGRAPEADVRIDHRSVSRSHARLIRDGDHFFVEDAGGQNGTFVNDERVSSRTPIAAGARLRIGHVEVTASIVGGRRETKRTATAMSTTVVDMSDALGADLNEQQTKAFAVPAIAADDLAAGAAGEGPDAEPTADVDLDGAVEPAQHEPLVTYGAGAPAYGLDALSHSVAEFARTFDEVHAALLRFREAYEALGGRDAAIDVAAHAAVVSQDPEEAETLAGLGQQAERIRRMAEAVLDLAVTLGPTGDAPPTER